MPTLRQLAAHLDAYLRAERHAGERNGVLVDRDRPVARIALALDVSDAAAAAADERTDALLLHRAWGFEGLTRHAALGVLAYHLPFDDRMTLGDNPRLAALLEMTSVEPLHDATPRVIGMVGDLPERGAAELIETLAQTFGGVEHATPPRRGAVRRVAVVGAMTAALVDEAARRGADLYLTGQRRAPALGAVGATGIGVVAVGHARAERWGLRCLAGLLRERWAGLDVTVCTPAA